MPLLGDSKSVYVGTTPITKVMAGSVEVWPKGPPPPFRNVQIWSCRFDEKQFADGLCVDPSVMSCSSTYMTWDVYPRPKNCARGQVYSVEGRNLNSTDPWKKYATFGVAGGRSYLPDSMPYSMASVMQNKSSIDPESLRKKEWRLVYDDGLEPIVYSDALTFTGTDKELMNQALPLAYQENECSGRP